MKGVVGNELVILHSSISGRSKERKDETNLELGKETKIWITASTIHQDNSALTMDDGKCVTVPGSQCFYGLIMRSKELNSVRAV